MLFERLFGRHPIKYVRMREGYLYLVAVIDYFSRYVLSWELSASLETAFCVASPPGELKRKRLGLGNGGTHARITRLVNRGSIHPFQPCIDVETGRIHDLRRATPLPRPRSPGLLSFSLVNNLFDRGSPRAQADRW